MHPTFPLLAATDFPQIHRGTVETLQVNLGYRCNQSCVHCHVNAGPTRTEEMSAGTADAVIAFLGASPTVSTLDLTGGAPELNANFRRLVRAARRRDLRVIDRCNLTILEEPRQEDLAAFLAWEGVEVVASLPCYIEDNVDRQRGNGVFGASIRGLRKLNALGYGEPDSGLVLNLVYNPQGPALPPPQAALEAAYREHLGTGFGIRFNQLFTLANMPIKRFGSMLVSKRQFSDYMKTLRGAHRPENLAAVMCRSVVSVDWRGYLYDCDFNQQLDMPIVGTRGRLHIHDAASAALAGRAIRVADHCYGCTAGQGSSCGGALGESNAESNAAAPACAA